MTAERAIREHGAILAIANQLRTVVAGQLAPDRAHSLLREFATRVEDHRSEEARDLYEPLLAYAKERSDEFGTVLNGMLTSASTDWSSYFDQWTPERMAADWSTFGDETQRVLDLGRARLCLENELLYPLAVREGILAE